MRKRVEEIIAFNEAPVETQAELLRDLVSKARNTTYGQLHHFEHVSDREVFSKLVPLSNLRVAQAAHRTDARRTNRRIVARQN